MSEAAKIEPKIELDTSDVDQWIGKRIVFAEFWDPCCATDIRRWVQALDYPNPLHSNRRSSPEIEIRRHRRAAILHGRAGLRPWLSSGRRRQDSRVASDLRGRGMVVLRHVHSPRRQADSRAPLRRLQRFGNGLCRTDHVHPRRHRPSQSAWRAGCPRSARRRSVISSPRRINAASMARTSAARKNGPRTNWPKSSICAPVDSFKSRGQIAEICRSQCRRQAAAPRDRTA